MKKRSSNSVSRVVLSSRHTNLLERARAFPVEAVRPWGDKAKFTAEYCDVRPLTCAVCKLLMAASPSAVLTGGTPAVLPVNVPFGRFLVAGGPDPGLYGWHAVGEEAEITGASR